MRVSRGELLMMAYRRRHPWRFAFMMYCVGFTACSLVVEGMGLFGANTDPGMRRWFRYLLPLSFAVLPLFDRRSRRPPVLKHSRSESHPCGN